MNWKDILPWRRSHVTAAQDRDNFVTNRITVADYEDGHAVGTHGVLGLTAAWACINLIAGTGASLPLGVFRTTADGIRLPAKDHPLYRILHDSPNADQTAIRLLVFPLTLSTS